MSILISENILNRIKEELSCSTESFFLVSAFCKLTLVKFFDSCIGDKKLEKKLVVRFRLSDIIAGASDLDLYPYCKQNGWKLFFRLDLHAKTYVFDRLRCIIGSANATQNGMNMGINGNFEIATFCELDTEDAIKMENLLYGSVEMNDHLYNTMQEIVKNIRVSTSNSSEEEWPYEIEDLFNADYSLLFSEDFPMCEDPRNANENDMIFLNLHSGTSLDDISKAFRKSKCFLWLCNLIKKNECKTMYFGEISANLHNCLLNEPKPYRKDVKVLLSNLLNWIEILHMEEFLIDRPKHSQRVRYIK